MEPMHKNSSVRLGGELNKSSVPTLHGPYIAIK